MLCNAVATKATEFNENLVQQLQAAWMAKIDELESSELVYATAARVHRANAGHELPAVRQAAFKTIITELNVRSPHLSFTMRWREVVAVLVKKE